MLRSFVVVGLAFTGAVVSQAAETGPVHRWISQLDNEKFAVRERATSDLIAADHKAALAAVVRTA